jgi:hypothetical protein
MSSGKVGDPVIHAETGAPAGATYILHPRRSFGARLGRFFSRLFVLSFVAVAGFGGGYAFNEREGLLARQDLLATISTIEKQVLQAETIREARDAHSMTIEVDMAPMMAELRLELAKVAQARVTAASGRLASALHSFTMASRPWTQSLDPWLRPHSFTMASRPWTQSLDPWESRWGSTSGSCQPPAGPFRRRKSRGSRRPPQSEVFGCIRTTWPAPVRQRPLG